MAPKLYFVPATRSTRPRWLLEELGTPYELVKLDPKKGDTKSEAYLKINPLGHVPSLVDGDVSIVESAAIVMYLADTYGQGRIAPAPGSPDRGEYYQWIMLAHATLEPALQVLHDHKAGKVHNPPALAAAKARVHDIAKAIDQKLNGRRYCAGNAFSAADIVLGGALAWANMFGQLQDFPRLQNYATTHMSRPAAKRAREA